MTEFFVDGYEVELFGPDRRLAFAVDPDDVISRPSDDAVILRQAEEDTFYASR